MINYIEKGIELHQEIEKRGYKLYELDGQWVSDNDIEVQKIIDDFIIIDNTPNWDLFNATMLNNERFIEVSSIGFQINPAAVSSLPAALAQVTTNGVSAFSLIWNFVCYLGGATPEDRLAWSLIAENNNLPSEFVNVLKG